MAGYDAPDPAVLDRALLRELTATLGRPVVAGYLERALGDAAAALAQLAAPDLDQDAARHLAHRLRGTAASFGLTAIVAAAARLEAGGSIEHGRTELAAALRTTREVLAAEDGLRPAPPT